MLMKNGSNQEPYHEAQCHQDWETGRELRITQPPLLSNVGKQAEAIRYLKGEHRRLYQKNYTPKIQRQYKGEDSFFLQTTLT